jgi:hypothetical protein
MSDEPLAESSIKKRKRENNGSDDSGLEGQHPDGLNDSGHRPDESPKKIKTNAYPPVATVEDVDDDEFDSQTEEEDVMDIDPNPDFNLFTGLMDNTEICIEIYKHLEPEELLTVYSMSRKFHDLMNAHFFSFIKASASVNAPSGHIAFPFQCFRRLCIEDPANREMVRQNSVHPTRHIPGFKWLSMVTGRHNICEQIMFALHQAGHDMPVPTAIVAQKIWFTMSFPSNGSRLALLHNQDYWSEIDLYLAIMFMIKLDMRFTDPTHGRGEVTLRKVFLGQTGLAPLHMLLTNQLNIVHVIQHFVRYDYQPSTTNRNLPIFGVPPLKIGRGCFEAWGAGLVPMLRIDEGVLREAIRRGIKVHKHVLDMVLYGYQERSDSTPYLNNPAMGPRTWEREFDYPLDALDMPQDKFFWDMENKLPGINAVFQTVQDPAYWSVTQID